MHACAHVQSIKRSIETSQVSESKACAASSNNPQSYSVVHHMACFRMLQVFNRFVKIQTHKTQASHCTPRLLPHTHTLTHMHTSKILHQERFISLVAGISQVLILLIYMQGALRQRALQKHACMCAIVTHTRSSVFLLATPDTLGWTLPIHMYHVTLLCCCLCYWRRSAWHTGLAQLAVHGRPSYDTSLLSGAVLFFSRLGLTRPGPRAIASPT